MQWLQDPSKINGDDLNDIRHEVSRHFTIKKREYLKYKINELVMNSKSNNVRDLYNRINKCKRGYQHRCYLKNAVIWDVAPCGCCKNQHFGGMYCLHHHGDKNRRARNNVSSN
jgi:hypothetical protein